MHNGGGSRSRPVGTRVHAFEAGVSMGQAPRKTENLLMRRVALLAILSIFSNPAHAHNYWANGKKVPDWVKGACCGPADVHKLTMSNVHSAPWNEDYLIVDGYKEPIRKATALPSEDGFVWIFYKDDVNTPSGQSAVYCLFVPMDE